ncbi:MAG: WHG domain-containing protein, partial [bacterium]|nr:WHG domain-containing protein [bacterium]
FRLLGEELRRAVAAHDQPANRLGEAGIAYVVFAAAHPARYHVMFNPELAERAAHPSLQAAEADTRRLLLGAVEELHAAGSLSGRNPDELSLAAWSSIHGLASLITNGYVRPARAEEIAHTVAHWVIPGFGDMDSDS